MIKQSVWAVAGWPCCDWAIALRSLQSSDRIFFGTAKDLTKHSLTRHISLGLEIPTDQSSLIQRHILHQLHVILAQSLVEFSDSDEQRILGERPGLEVNFYLFRLLFGMQVEVEGVA